MVADQASERAFLGTAALLFAASAAATILWCAAMSDMGAIPMEGGGTLSMAFMPMCGQGWPGTAASFLGMWVVMMAAMMLPSLTPMLARYRRALVAAGASRLGRLTLLVSAGYLVIWTLVGVAVFVPGAALAALAMERPGLARAAPFAAGMVVLMAGAFQFTASKARHLACCRRAPERGRVLPANAATALRHGLLLGTHCVRSCAGPTAVLLALGVMDLGMMALVATAITLERLSPRGEQMARVTGALAIVAGVALIMQAGGFA